MVTELKCQHRVPWNRGMNQVTKENPEPNTLLDFLARLHNFRVCLLPKEQHNHTYSSSRAGHGLLLRPGLAEDSTTACTRWQWAIPFSLHCSFLHASYTWGTVIRLLERVKWDKGLWHSWLTVGRTLNGYL